MRAAPSGRPGPIENGDEGRVREDQRERQGPHGGLDEVSAMAVHPLNHGITEFETSDSVPSIERRSLVDLSLIAASCP